MKTEKEILAKINALFEESEKPYDEVIKSMDMPESDDLWEDNIFDHKRIQDQCRDRKNMLEWVLGNEHSDMKSEKEILAKIDDLYEESQISYAGFLKSFDYPEDDVYQWDVASTLKHMKEQDQSWDRISMLEWVLGYDVFDYDEKKAD